MILSIDPGTQKCGLAVLEHRSPPQILHRAVVATTELPDAVRGLLATYSIETVLIGNATYGQTVATTVRPLLPAQMAIHFVREAYTSERAKKRWCAENPPRNLWERLLPGFRTPTEPIDDYAAAILAEDWLTES